MLANQIKEAVRRAINRISGGDNAKDVDGEKLYEALLAISQQFEDMAITVKQKLDKGERPHITIRHDQFRDIESMRTLRGGPSEPAWHKQCGPLVTEITILDYTNAGKDLTKEEA
jgi:hypothetical protein